MHKGAQVTAGIDYSQLVKLNCPGWNSLFSKTIKPHSCLHKEILSALHLSLCFDFWTRKRAFLYLFFFSFFLQGGCRIMQLSCTISIKITCPDWHDTIMQDNWKPFLILERQVWNQCPGKEPHPHSRHWNSWPRAAVLGAAFMKVIIFLNLYAKFIVLRARIHFPSVMVIVWHSWSPYYPIQQSLYIYLYSLFFLI